MPDEPKFSNRPAPTLYFITGVKLFKGALLLLAALGIFALAGKDLQELFNQFLVWVHLDPENKFFAAIGDRLDTITPHNVKLIASGTFLYGAFMTVGGLGLAFRAWWAGSLAICESAFFIPIEIYELLRHYRWQLWVVLGFNILIVWYLYSNRKRLFHHHHH